ncbi:NUDIX hydrolase [Cytophagaceae bacterium ABcell3]|nr:NUDIX hydrolase [Cytophagaceae bacterium ABcell3]
MKRKGKLFFYRKDAGKVFVLLGQRENKGEHFWWLPGGGADEGETVFEGAVRELSEELYPTVEIKAAVDRFSTSGKEPEAFQYKTSISENTVFFVEVKQDSDVLPEIRDEFEKMQWFPVNSFPGNMSREFRFFKPGMEAFLRSL